MKVSMNGLRRNIARAYNDLVDARASSAESTGEGVSYEELDAFQDLEQFINSLMIVYHDGDEDFSELDIQVDDVRARLGINDDW